MTYKRADGVPLSFTLYLPPDYKEGTRLPAFIWAYPREFTDADTAGQVGGSPYHFTTLTGPSHLFLVLQGYAVLDGATMPIVGDPEKVNDTFVDQLVASAKAAIDKAEEMGVIDAKRVAAGMKRTIDDTPDQFDTFVHKQPEHIELAGALGLGEYDETKIDLRKIRI